MTKAQIDELVDCFAQGARRAREAGADGIEVHGCNGYLITQFLSPAINDRKDEYGGSLENRARFALEIVRAIRRRGRRRLPPAVQDHRASTTATTSSRGATKGTTLEESMQVCKWLEEAGVDAFHVSSGNSFPHPRNPAGGFPIEDVVRGYDTMISSGRHTFRNFLLFKIWPLNKRLQVGLGAGGEGAGRGDQPRRLPRAIKEAVSVPVLCTGGFQTASVVAAAIERGDCDGVTIAPPADRQPGPRRSSGEPGTTGRRGRAPTRTSASSTSSRTRSAATTRAGSSRARRWCAEILSVYEPPAVR